MRDFIHYELFLTATAHDLKGGRRLAEAHLRVPEHVVVLLEPRQGVVDCLLLFLAEDERLRLLQFGGVEGDASRLDRGNRLLDRLKVDTEPFTAFRARILYMLKP